jgi:NADPH-dependent curcumin reductase CurA
LSDITIDQNNIANITFAESYSNIGVNTFVNVFNSSVSTFNTTYIVLSMSESSVTARGVESAPISYGGSINKIDDEILIPNYKLESIQMYGYTAYITYAELYDPIDVGKIVTVVNSNVSIKVSANAMINIVAIIGIKIINLITLTTQELILFHKLEITVLKFQSMAHHALLSGKLILNMLPI